MQIITHFIAGKRDEGTGTRQGPVYDPSTGARCATVAFATATDVDRAVTCAADAFPAWSDMTPLARARVLFRFKTLLERDMDVLAGTITREHGKTLDDARGEITRGIEVVEFACGSPHLLRGDFTAQVGHGVDAYSVRHPLGVCAIITPFNFPAMVPMWMFPIALACGNTVVLKPSEKDPGASLLLADLLREAGLPDGVFNVVQGDKVAVDALLTHPLVAAVSFVGSTAIGDYVYRTATAHGKRAQALCGAKNHMVVMPDADLDACVSALMGAAYGAAGERCMAVSVAVAVGGVGEALVSRLVSAISALRIGSGLDPQSDMGPLVTQEHRARVVGFIDEGVREGATLVVDGRSFKPGGLESGFFLGASLFDHVRPEMTIYKEEIFGPVLCVMRVDTLDEAIRLVSDHDYGNGAAIFTRNGDAARIFSARAEAGMIGVNVPIPVPVAFHSFGGWKRSIFGDHDVYGMDGVAFYTRIKTTTVRWPAGLAQGTGFAMPVS